MEIPRPCPGARWMLIGTAMQIRLLEPGDAAILRQVLSWSRPSEQVTPGRAETLLADSRTLYLTALTPDGLAAGWCMACVFQRFTGDVVFLYELDVRADYRRQGLGRRLVEALQAQCRKRGIRGIFVLTQESNLAAMALYSRTGARRRFDDEALFEYAL